MDAQLWHDYCVAVPPEEPPALTRPQWKKLSDEQRDAHIDRLDRWLNHLYVDTDELTAIATTINETVKNNLRRDPGARELIGLTGPNVIGKSTLMMRWGRTQYLEWTAGVDVDKRGRPVVTSQGIEVDLCPVVWINLPAGATSGDVDREILGFFALEDIGRVKSYTKRAITAAHRHGALVLIVDDAQLLKTDWKGGRVVLDHVKHLNTKLGWIDVTLIVVGADLQHGALIHDPQIAGRLQLRTITPYKAATVDQRRTWQRIVLQIENLVLPHLPAGKPGMLYLDLAGELWCRTQGYLGDLTKLVCGATLAATVDGAHRIRVKDLDAVELSERAKKGRPTEWDDPTE